MHTQRTNLEQIKRVRGKSSATDHRAVGPGRRTHQNRPEIVVGDFKIDILGHRVFVQGKEVYLRPKEFDLLTYFARHPERLIASPELLRSIWGPTSVDHNEYLRVCIGQLRKKLGSATSKPYIVTQHWIGYRFMPG